MKNCFRITAAFRTRLESLGVNTAAVLRQAGQPADLFEQPRCLLDTEANFALWRAIEIVSPNPGIGLQLGSETRMERLPPAILAALAAPDFGSAIDQLARYKRLTCPEEVRQEFRKSEWKIRFCWLNAPAREPGIMIECCFAWVLTIARQGSGQHISPMRVMLRDPHPHARALERHFGCPVQGGARTNAIVFRAADARLPFLTRNAELQAILAPHLERELRRHGVSDRAMGGVMDLVRGAIRDDMSGHKPTLAEVARQLHRSTRTLQRQLRGAGVSFQHLLDDTRHRLACHYLARTTLELSEIAFDLGFEDSNSFVRAFHAWEGAPPGQWRRSKVKSRGIAAAS